MHNYMTLFTDFEPGRSPVGAGFVMKDATDGHLCFALSAGDADATWYLPKAVAIKLARALADAYLPARDC